MDTNYYLQISFDSSENNKILGFGLYDKGTKRYYNGFNRIGQNYDETYELDWILDTSKNKKAIQLNKKDFLKFKNLDFKKDISEKNLEQILQMIGLEEHAI